jgi:spore coat protein CotH
MLAATGGSSVTGGVIGAGGNTPTGGSSGSPTGGQFGTNGGQFGGTGGQPGGGQSGAGQAGGVSSGGQFGTTGGATTGGQTGGGQTSGGGSAGAAGAPGCPRYCGPSFDDLFDNKKLATIRIKMDAATITTGTWLDTLWAKWIHCPPFTNYLPVQMTYESPDSKGNVTLDKVGMRIRGSMPRGTNQLQGFKLDFQVLAGAPGPNGKRRFGDLNRLNELSVEANPSHLLQCLSYKMLRDFGLPAPRCNHLKVYVNDAYYGLMENVEQTDNKGFLRRHFGGSTGSFYAASPSADTCGWKDSQAKLEYSGDTFTGAYTKAYQLLKGTTAADAEKNLIPMMKCGSETATADDNAFKTCIADWIDVDEWLKQIAAESLLPTLESFIGYQRNYFLYFKPDPAAPHGGRFVVWSWDLDHTFQRQKCSPSSCNPTTAVSNLYIGTRPKLVTRLTTVFKAQYCTAMKNFMSNIYKVSAVDDMAAIVKPGITGDASVTPDAWQTEVTAIRNYVTSHSTDMNTQITTLCQ